MPVDSHRWLDVARHRLRGYRAPYLVILQHHDIPAPARIVAPITLPLPGDVDVLAPRLFIGGQEHRVRLLDMVSVGKTLLTEVEASATDIADEISAALDIILRGYPVGLPL